MRYWWIQRNMFIFIAKMVLHGRLAFQGKWADYKNEAENFVCNIIGKGNSNVKKSYGGLAWFNTWNNLQYTTASAIIATVYGQYLTDKVLSRQCPVGPPVNPNEHFNFAQSQVNYILGENPKNMSYMVGFGENYPKQIHHRAASIVSTKMDSAPVTCQDGIKDWLNRDAPDPNVLEGAVVGGPDDFNQYRAIFTVDVQKVFGVGIVMIPHSKFDHVVELFKYRTIC